MQNLPFDIIRLIIDELVPDLSIIALPQNHLTTRTLHALSLTSKDIHPVAHRVLLTHCLYINCPKRLGSLILDIISNGLPSGTLHSLYLAPFPDTANEVQIALEVQQLCMLIAPTLKRLIVDMPLATLSPTMAGMQVIRLLKISFNSLVELEDFYSVQHNLNIALPDTSPQGMEMAVTPIWSCWPKLKVLSLYNGYGNRGHLTKSRFWEYLAKLPCLETVVLTKTGAYPWQIREIRRQQGGALDKLMFIMVDAELDDPNYIVQLGSLGDASLKKVTLPIPYNYDGDEDEGMIAQAWTRKRILSGQPAEKWA